MRLLVLWLIHAVALLGVSYLIPSVQVAGFGSALIAALFLGLVNTMIRPVLVLLTLPVSILTLGLFIFVINGLLFLAVGSILRGFEVYGFWAAVFGAVVYSLFSWALAAIFLGKSPA
jgi:putative membrane protein